MAAWSSSTDSGDQPVVGYYRYHTVGVRVQVDVRIRVKVRLWG